MARRRRQPIGQSIGGVLFGFEQQVLRTMPPAQELVHHARPDDPVAAGDGGMLMIALPEAAGHHGDGSDAPRQPAAPVEDAPPAPVDPRPGP